MSARVLEELREAARAVAERAEARLADLGETECAYEALQLVRDAGLTPWTVPHAFGGADPRGLCAPTTVSARALCALRDELAYGHSMLDTMLVMQGLGSHPIALAGSDALRARVLPEVARGTSIAAFAVTEPDAGSNVAQAALRAEKHADAYVLDGTKTFISNAGIAHVYAVLARTSGEPGDGKGLSMFYVPGDARGLEVERFEVLAPHPIGTLRFHSVRVPAANLLGSEGQGLELALATLGRFRVSVAAAANGFARRALDESVRHLGARTQFGKPLASFQALRFDVAEIDVRLRAAQLLVDEAAARVDSGAPSTLEVARAKLFATEGASWICDRAVQHFGGLGVKKGVVVERLFRDVRALRIYEGTSEIQKLLIAKELLG